MQVPCTPWNLEEDGRLHSYTVTFAIRIGEAHEDGEADADERRREQLSPMRLFTGALPPAQGEKAEHVQIYKNGGVGALGTMGTSEASIKRGRWAWVAITRKKGSLKTCASSSELRESCTAPRELHSAASCTARELAARRASSVRRAPFAALRSLRSPPPLRLRIAWLLTAPLCSYVDGSLCADVTLKEPKAAPKDGKPPPPGKSGQRGEGGEGEEDEGMRKKEKLLKEVLCIEPQNFALFAPDAEAEGADEPRVLSLK